MPIVIIGGSDAGISAALRIRELDGAAQVAVLLADDFPNWSICGLPYFLSGETPEWRDLAHRTEFDGIDVQRQHRADHVDPARQVVTVRQPSGESIELSYDRLIIATGAVPIRPDLPGLDLPGVHLLHTMGDAFAVSRTLGTAPAPRSAVIVGAGYIGLEMAEALTHKGIQVTVVSRTPQVFPTVDPAFGQAIEAELGRNGVRVVVSLSVDAISRSADGSRLIALGSGFAEDTDLVLVAVGTQPDVGLARQAGVALGARGAVQVDRAMRTNVPGILAAGDCAETWHRVLGRSAYLPLGTTAHKQGRVAGETALGGDRVFEGSVGTQVVKLFDLAVARTGLLDQEAARAGFAPLTVETESWDHKAYYPGARQLWLRVTGDVRNGRLLGAQILGPWTAEIAKRIDVFGTALFHSMSVDGLCDLDLSYAPPFSSPWDPIQLAAQAWMKAARCMGQTESRVRKAD